MQSNNLDLFERGQRTNIAEACVKVTVKCLQAKQ